MRSEFDNDPSSVEYNTRRWYNILSIDGDVGVVIILPTAHADVEDTTYKSARKLNVGLISV